MTTLLQNQLINGVAAIVKQGDQYELVPAAVAEKIAQRDESRVILQNQKDNQEIDEDDNTED